jgi:hypothetical protein
VIEHRLSQLGFKATRFFKPEIRELQHILLDNEKIITLAQGRYYGGFALLVATDQRLLLIDKKALFLTLEDIRYDMISEIDFSSRLFDSTVSIFTFNKQHKFTTVRNKHHLRQLASYAQRRVMELRQQYTGPVSVDQQQAVQQPQMQQFPQQPVQVEAQVREPRFSALPSPKVSHLMGAAAVHASRSWMNPYTKSSLMMRKQWSKPLAAKGGEALEYR